MKRVAIGMVGSVLDAGAGDKRHRKWRPTVDLCRHAELGLHRLELLYQPKFERVARTVVDDIAALAPDIEVRLHALELEDPWDFEEVYGALHDFARAFPFSSREDYLVHITTGTHVVQICLYLLTEARFIPGRLLQTSPPRGERGAPGSHAIIDLDLSKYDRIASRFRRAQREGLSYLKAGIDTANAPFNELVGRLERVAVASNDPILLMGPTGAGKSVLARRVYELKRMRGTVRGDLVEVNCATLRGDGAMSALFGHVRGAFTGAQRDRPGLLRTADSGLLFLDEIGELGLDEQAMLLRAIEHGTFLPVGADREVRSDFQLISGTNRALRERVRQGRFREDLLARIDLWTFELPALRERLEDLPPNLEYELERQRERTGHNVTMSRDARRRFLDFAASPAATWPGNFRDLAASVTRMATLSSGGRIDRRTVDEEIARLSDTWARDRPSSAVDRVLEEVLGTDGAAALDRFDRVQLAEVLRVCRASESASAAGRTLFAASRARRKSTNDADRLRKYLARFGLTFQQLVER